MADSNGIDGAISISREELVKIGGSEASVKLPPESGGGYMGWLEIYHQIHCLVRAQPVSLCRVC